MKYGTSNTPLLETPPFPAESRIWAGAHFRPGVDEARRLGLLIAARAAKPCLESPSSETDIRVDVVVAAMRETTTASLQSHFAIVAIGHKEAPT